MSQTKVLAGSSG